MPSIKSTCYSWTATSKRSQESGDKRKNSFQDLTVKQISLCKIERKKTSLDLFYNAQNIPTMLNVQWDDKINL